MEVDSITYTLFSSEQIKRQSVCEITSPKFLGENTVYDERLGPCDTVGMCVTCSKKAAECMGHFGHIHLNRPVLHPLYVKYTLKFLRCFCYTCSKLLIPPAVLELGGSKNPLVQTDKILDQCRKLKKCYYCYDQKTKGVTIASKEKVEELLEEDQPAYTLNKEKEIVAVWSKKKQELSRRILSCEEIFEIFQKIDPKDMNVFRLNPTFVQPKFLIITDLPVLPICCRPFIRADDGSTYDDDLSKRYMEIVKVNQRILKSKLTVGKKVNDYAYNALQKHIQVLIDNTSLKEKHASRVFKSLKHRMTGKEGRIRSNLMGKRCNFTARTVAGPDPLLGVNEIAIPEQYAKQLTIPERVNQLNHAQLQKLVYSDRANFLIKKNGTKINLEYALYRKPHNGRVVPEKGDTLIRQGIKIIVKDPKMYVAKAGDRILKNKVFFRVEMGDTVERHLRDGDTVILNRQPTLHRGSIYAMKVKIHPGHTIRTNLAITSTYNLDYDGDELNIHVPQTIMANADIGTLASVENNLINSQDGKPLTVLIQDSLLGLYLLTKEKTLLSKEDVFQLIMVLQSETMNDAQFTHKLLDRLEQLVGCSVSKIKQVTGRQVFSLLLPQTFYHKHAECVITRGVLEGTIVKQNIHGIISSLHHVYGKEACVEFVNNAQFLGNTYAVQRGFSVGYKDCILSRNMKTSDIQQKVDSYFEEATIHQRHLTNPFIRETRIRGSLNKAKDMGQNIAKQAMTEDNSFREMIVSGSKGNYINICQISGLLGQQNVSGQRIRKMLSEGERTLSCFPFKEDQTPNSIKYASRGFIRSSFLSGLNAPEFFFHASSGREGITDTACKTADSGYLQRKMVKLLEDIRVSYDHTVRNAKGTIVQFAYGDDGMDGIHLNNKQEFVNLHQLSEKLNAEYEDSL